MREAGAGVDDDGCRICREPDEDECRTCREPEEGECRTCREPEEDDYPAAGGSDDVLARLPRSAADFYEEMWAAERKRTAMRSPRGDLDDEALRDLLYRLTAELFKARVRGRFTQEDVAASMGIAKSGVSRLEGRVQHAPSVSTLMRFARAVGCDLEIRLVPQTTAPAPTSDDQRGVGDSDTRG